MILLTISENLITVLANRSVTLQLSIFRLITIPGQEKHGNNGRRSHISESILCRVCRLSAHIHYKQAKTCTIVKLDARGLQNNCIYGNHILDGVVTGIKIANGVVETKYLANDILNLSKLQ